VLGGTLALTNRYLSQDERLGVVHLPIFCGCQSQKAFTTATALLHQRTAALALCSTTDRWPRSAAPGTPPAMLIAMRLASSPFTGGEQTELVTRAGLRLRLF